MAHSLSSQGHHSYFLLGDSIFENAEKPEAQLPRMKALGSSVNRDNPFVAMMRTKEAWGIKGLRSNAELPKLWTRSTRRHEVLS